MTESGKQAGGEEIAHALRRRIKKELGLTVSIGVSWNKVFAKLGSDMNKPDAVTVISPDNFRQTVWTLPAEELLYVGRATKGKLNRMGIFTIGELANSDRGALKHRLGKWGEWLHDFANGKDSSRVVKTSEEQNVKSIGNSLTVWRDLKTAKRLAWSYLCLPIPWRRVCASRGFFWRAPRTFSRGAATLIPFTSRASFRVLRAPQTK